MQAKITQITLVVKDQTEALEYYTKKVGFEKKTDFTPPGSYRWVHGDPRERLLSW
jgi:catechol-2,3-dioxygenase